MAAQTPNIVDLAREVQEQAQKNTEQFVEASYAFAARALELQKQYTLRALAALKP